MSKKPGSLATPADQQMQMAQDDAEPAVLAGHRAGTGGLPLAVDLRGVRKSFGTVQAVRGVALAVGAGEVMAFLGPNGAGKTTTIDMILGLSRPDAGAVEVYGMAPRHAGPQGPGRRRHAVTQPRSRHLLHTYGRWDSWIPDPGSGHPEPSRN